MSDELGAVALPMTIWAHKEWAQLLWAHEEPHSESCRFQTILHYSSGVPQRQRWSQRLKASMSSCDVRRERSCCSRVGSLSCSESEDPIWQVRAIRCVISVSITIEAHHVMMELCIMRLRPNIARINPIDWDWHRIKLSDIMASRSLEALLGISDWDFCVGIIKPSPLLQDWFGALHSLLTTWSRGAILINLVLATLCRSLLCHLPRSLQLSSCHSGSLWCWWLSWQ